MYKQQDSSTSHGATAEAAQRWPMTQAEGLPHHPRFQEGPPFPSNQGHPSRVGCCLALRPQVLGTHLLPQGPAP